MLINGWARLYGADTPDRMIGKTVVELAHPDDPRRRGRARARRHFTAPRPAGAPVPQRAPLKFGGEVEVKSIAFEYRGRRRR